MPSVHGMESLNHGHIPRGRDIPRQTRHNEISINVLIIDLIQASISHPSIWLNICWYKSCSISSYGFLRCASRLLHMNFRLVQPRDAFIGRNHSRAPLRWSIPTTLLLCPESTVNHQMRLFTKRSDEVPIPTDLCRG